MLRMAIGLGLAAALTSGAQAQVNTQDIKWGPGPASLPSGAQMAVLSGDPGGTGMFVIRARLPAGYKIAPHHHPTTEYVTVLSGDLHLAMGDKFDTSRGAGLAPCGFAAAEAMMNHYAWTTSGAEIQVQAQGPFQVIYVNPADDPSRR